MIPRPEFDELAPFYHNYLRNAPEGDVLTVLGNQQEEIAGIFRSISEQKADYAYATGKWSIKQMAGHLTDTERLFVYRAMSFSREENCVLPGMNQDVWAAAGHFEARPLTELAGELYSLRTATISFFRGLPESAHMKRGIASGVSFTVRALAYVIAGHERHHINIIREKYLPGV